MPPGDSAPEPEVASKPDDRWAVLRVPGFKSLILARFFSGTAMTLLRATVVWHIFHISQSEQWVGAYGLAAFAPVLLFTPIAGSVADTHDRRRVAMVAQCGGMLMSSLLCYLSFAGVATVPVLLTVVVPLAICAAFENPSRIALLPQIVPRGLLHRAVTVHTGVQALALASGPVACGFALEWGGPTAAYGLHAVLMATSIVLFIGLRAPPREGPRAGVSVRTFVEGLSYVRKNRALLGCMTLDMFAVIFAGVTALLPVYCSKILHVGESEYGFLGGALDVGAVCMALILAVLPPVRRVGKVLLWSVAVYAVATIGFGLSRDYFLSLIIYAVVGMADYVSVVMRGTTVQMVTPDALRGRVSAINMLFIHASNQLSVAWAGYLAALTSPVFAVVFGGCAALFVVGIVAIAIPELRRYRRDGTGD